jgi:5-methylcytosine-specific restriction endonuclease McrA
MPINYKDYGQRFKELSKELRSFGRCAYCGAQNHKDNPRTGSKVVLTVHHLDKDIGNNSVLNLVPLCQQCHFAAHKGKTPWYDESRYSEYERWLWDESKIFSEQSGGTE